MTLEEAIAEVQRVMTLGKPTEETSDAWDVIGEALVSGDLIPKADHKLAVALAYQQAREVKPLEWKQAGGNIRAGQGYSAWGHLSHTPTTTYQTHKGWWLSVDCKTYPTLEAAKAAAQADYTARILSALKDPTP